MFLACRWLISTALSPSIASPEVPRTQRNVPIDTWPQVPAPASPPTTKYTLIRKRSRLLPSKNLAQLRPTPLGPIPWEKPRLSRHMPGGLDPGFVVLRACSDHGLGLAHSGPALLRAVDRCPSNSQHQAAADGQERQGLQQQQEEAEG